MITFPLPIVDDFDRANESPPSGWIPFHDGYDDLAIVGNECLGSEGAGNGNAMAWDELFESDMGCGITFSGALSESVMEVGLFARITPQAGMDDFDGYAIGIYRSGGNDTVSALKIIDFTGESLEPLTVNVPGTELGRNIVSGDQMGLSVQTVAGDVVLKLWLKAFDGDWFIAETWTDATDPILTSGYVGLYLKGNAYAIDDFMAGESSGYIYNYRRRRI